MASCLLNTMQILPHDLNKLARVRLRKAERWNGPILAPHLDCWDSRWTEARIYATLTLVLWGVLFPIGLAVILDYFRKRLRTAEFSRR